MPWLVRVVFGSEYLPAVDAARIVLVAAAIQLVLGWSKSLPVTVGTTGGEFDVLADGCSPAIPPLSDCNIDVAFAPSASGDQQGELVVTGAAKPPSLGVAGFELR